MCGLSVTAITETRSGTPAFLHSPGYGSRVSRRRADTLLAERGLSPSRTAAARSVRAGHVRLPGGRLIAKPSELLPADAELILEGGREFVSRGGIKLENALEALPIEIAGRRCLDVGASTGGFTDCLLRRGAESVIALDVGYGQLDWGLREDPRVTVLERVNGRELRPELLPYVPDLVTIDVSFISIVKLLEPVARCAAEGWDLIGLVKPQFELGAKRVGRGGVVRVPEDRRDALRTVARAAAERGLTVRGFAPSGLAGPKGNLETFIWCDRSGDDSLDVEAAISEIE